LLQSIVIAYLAIPILTEFIIESIKNSPPYPNKIYKIIQKPSQPTHFKEAINPNPINLYQLKNYYSP